MAAKAVAKAGRKAAAVARKASIAARKAAIQERKAAAMLENGGVMPPTPPKPPKPVKIPQPIVPKATQITLKRALGMLIADLRPKSTIFFDFKGRDLSREGKLDIITVFQRLDGPQPMMPVNKGKRIVGKPADIRTASNIWVLNMHKLGAQGWQPACAAGTRRTLQRILRTPEHTKVLWGVDDQARALHLLHGVKLGQPVVDIKIMEKIVRAPEADPHMEWDLHDAVAGIPEIKPEQLAAWKETQAQGMNLYDTSTNEGTDLFKEARLHRAIIEHAASDVRYLPALYLGLRAVMTDEQFALAKELTARRVHTVADAAGEPVADVDKIEFMREKNQAKRQDQLKREERRKKKIEKLVQKKAKEGDLEAVKKGIAELKPEKPGMPERPRKETAREAMNDIFKWSRLGPMGTAKLY